MTEVERLGHLGLVRGPRPQTGQPHLLHIVPHSFSAPDFHFHGSTKDTAGRHQYFRDRGVAFDVFHHKKNVDALANRLKDEPDLPDYSHILVDGSFTLKDWKFLKARWPDARLIARSHNSELPHRKDAQRALWEAAPTDDMARQTEDKKDARNNRRVFLDRDLAAAKYADAILTIETLKPAARYWSWLGFRGELVACPYFLTDEYLKEIETTVEDKIRARRDWIVCVMSSHPGPLTYHALLNFHRAVKALGEGKPDWRFRATGRSFWIKNHADFSPRVKPLGIVDDLLELLCVSRGIAVLSDLGRGFKTKILEAILCRSWVLINPVLFRRLPEAVKPYCIVVDLESPHALDEALDRIERKDWPGGDPNSELRAEAYAAMDHALFGASKARPAVGATLSADPGHQKSQIAWHDPAVPSDGALEVTVCTVLTPVHKKVAAHNYELMGAMNPGVRLHWNVVDNGDIHMNDKRIKAFARQLAKTRGKVGPDKRDRYLQAAKEEYFDYGDIAGYMPGARVIEGPSLQAVFDEFLAALNSTPEEEKEHRHFLSKFLGSYHHAAGLNRALEQVKTRYAVVLDPDLYVVRPGWVEQVIRHMQAHDLAVFGAPWNPRWYQKYRYFPCTHLMVVDLQKYRYRKDMLAPDLVRPGGKYISTYWQEEAARPEGPSLGRLLRRLPRALREDFRQRSTIGRSHDTGYTLMEEFATRPGLKSEVLTPVFADRDGFQPATVTRLQRMLDAVLPDRLSYMPRRPGYASAKGFAEHGAPGVRELGWEEFLWQGSPFAFHVRGEMHRKPIGRTDDVQVLNRLNAILRAMGRPPMADRTVGGADLHAVEVDTWRHLDQQVEAERQEAPADAG